MAAILAEAGARLARRGLVGYREMATGVVELLASTIRK
jgi:hypothetical protein